MKKFTFSFKSLLLAAGLLLGSANAWANEANLTPTADTYFSWDAGDTSYGTAETLYCGIWQEMWTNATPGIKGTNGSKNIAVFKFDVSEYKGKITAATFKVTATNPSSNTNTRSIYLGYFDLTTWTESSTANNSGMVTRAASGLNIHPFSLSQSIAKGETKEVSFSNDALLTYLNNDADGIVSLIIYGLGQQCSVNSKEAASGKPSLTLTYTDETVYTATFTANSGAITPTVNIYSDAGRTTPVTNGTLTDKTTYYYRAVLAGYDNYEGSFTVDGTNPSVSFTMTAKTRYTFTVNAVDAGSNVLKTIYTDADSYEGKSHTIVYPKYLTGTGNIVTYSKDNDTYGENKTAQAQNETYTVGYTAYDGVAYFVEVEDVVSATAYGSWNCSNGGAVRGFTDARSIFTVPATGVYDITYAACNNNVNYAMAVTLSKNEAEIATKSDLQSVSINKIKTEGIVSNNNVSLASGDVLRLTPSTTNGIIDYMLVELKSVPVTISGAGYATFSSSYALDLTTANTPDGLTAYYIEDDKLTKDNAPFTTIDQTVEAGQGILLKGNAGTYNIKVAASGDALEDNALVATNGSAIAEGNYVFAYETANPSATAGFYYVNADTDPVAAGKAYLNGTLVPINVKAFIFDGTTTGIETAPAAEAEEDGVYYNTAGQVVTKDYKGIVIKNGKKYFNK